jgi:hypothetical protein
MLKKQRLTFLKITLHKLIKKLILWNILYNFRVILWQEMLLGQILLTRGPVGHPHLRAEVHIKGVILEEKIPKEFMVLKISNSNFKIEMSIKKIILFRIKKMILFKIKILNL